MIDWKTILYIYHCRNDTVGELMLKTSLIFSPGKDLGRMYWLKRCSFSRLRKLNLLVSL